jgi:CDP-diacylglycerol--serine O-phosphatidyltransferase
MMVKQRLLKQQLTAVKKTKTYKKGTQFLPFIFTFANAFLGLLAIIQAMENNYITAIYCLMLAAAMDSCDGRLARAFGTESRLGTELDSLADAISFCLAPCIVLYSWFPGTFGYTGFFALGSYLFAGIFRLAKFNMLVNEPPSPNSSSNFIGLPTPVAALAVLSLVLYSHWILDHSVRFILYKQVPFFIIGTIALLMISSIPFPSFKKFKRLSFLHVLGLSILWGCMLFLLIHGYPLLFIGVSLYISSSIARWLYARRTV